MAADPESARAVERTGRLRYLDAATTLAGLLRDGRPDAALFAAGLGELMRKTRRRAGSGRVRAFGYSFYCAYPIDFVAACAGSEDLAPIIGTHTHLCAGPGTVISSGYAGR